MPFRGGGHLRENYLGRWALREEFTEIQPGIKSGEIEQFGGSTVDLSAEFTLEAGIQVRRKRVITVASEITRIASRGRQPLVNPSIFTRSSFISARV